MADGYLILGARDGYKYSIGMGKSETTVLPHLTLQFQWNNSDDKRLSARYVASSTRHPSSLSCIVETQMQYLHLQMPITGIHNNVTMEGVPVLLTGIDSEGNHVEIGETVTNGYYGTFNFPWTPGEQGTYEIIATFAGDDSYGIAQVQQHL
jgi:hypothetical protein